MSAVRFPTTRVSILASMLSLALALPVVAAMDNAHDGRDHDDDRDDRRDSAPRRAPMPAIYVEECGACHAPYPASGLPAASWRDMMTGLDRHFGVDATLAPRETTIVRDWLIANAGRHAAAPAAPLRITRTAWFLREHDEIPKSVWRSAAVGTPANCGGCHRGADRGVFSEHDVRLPRASAPRPTDGAKR